MSLVAPLRVPNRHAMPDSFAALDAKVARLHRHQAAWQDVSIRRRIDYLEACIAGVHRVAPRLVAASVQAKGLAQDSPRAGEDWFASIVTMQLGMRSLQRSLQQLVRTGTYALDPARVRTRPDGQVKVQVYPETLYERLAFEGVRGEVWLERGVTRATLADQVGLFYTKPETSPPPAVALILGAGNVHAIAPMDVIHKLFLENHVCLVKFNPVNDYIGPYVEEAFAPLIAAGFLETAYGGAEVGEYLCFHDGIDEIHITGSGRTHDVIVYGPGEEGAQRKREGRPRLHKPITSELGNIAPCIVVPGRWSKADLRFQAERVATYFTQNAGFNCLDSRLLVTHQGWPQRQAFLDRLAEVLEAQAPRPAYYPGTEERMAAFVREYPHARTLGTARPGVVPPLFIPGIDPADRTTLAFRFESFTQVVAETALPGRNAQDFLRRAVRFCNDTVYGTLNVDVLIDPVTQKALGAEVEQAVADLRYGTVGVNGWSGAGFVMGALVWGAHPGHTLDDIQSGIGFVRNTALLDHPAKSVVWGSFREVPKPAWFVTHAHGDEVGERAADLMAYPAPEKLPPLFAWALRG